MHSNKLNWLKKLFNNTTKSFLAKIVTVKLKPSLLINASLHVHPLTFITEVLHLTTSYNISIIMYNIIYIHIPAIYYTNETTI